jgi:hypothetical protein
VCVCVCVCVCVEDWTQNFAHTIPLNYTSASKMVSFRSCEFYLKWENWNNNKKLPLLERREEVIKNIDDGGRVLERRGRLEAALENCETLEERQCAQCFLHDALKITSGLTEWLKWYSTCLASVRTWVPVPALPKKKKKRERDNFSEELSYCTFWGFYWSGIWVSFACNSVLNFTWVKPYTCFTGLPITGPRLLTTNSNESK